MSITEEVRSEDVVEELRDWLSENWDPDLTCAQWWERLGLAGYSQPIMPVGRYGRGLSRGDAIKVQQTITAHGALSSASTSRAAPMAPWIVGASRPR